MSGAVEAWFLIAVWAAPPAGLLTTVRATVESALSHYQTEAECFADAPNVIHLDKYPGKVGIVCLKGVIPQEKKP